MTGFTRISLIWIFPLCLTGCSLHSSSAIEEKTTFSLFLSSLEIQDNRYRKNSGLVEVGVLEAPHYSDESGIVYDVLKAMNPIKITLDDSYIELVDFYYTKTIDSYYLALLKNANVMAITYFPDRKKPNTLQETDYSISDAERSALVTAFEGVIQKGNIF
jgi:hypothetical protein